MRFWELSTGLILKLPIMHLMEKLNQILKWVKFDLQLIFTYSLVWDTSRLKIFVDDVLLSSVSNQVDYL